MSEYKQHSDYKLLIPGKSWIFVNPSHGCPLSCAYCVEKKDKWFENKVTEVYSPNNTIERLVNTSWIYKNKTPLTFYNFSDPFLKSNKKNLFSILKELDKKGWQNKVGLITKIHPGKNYLGKLSRLSNLKLAIFVSHANLLPGFEAVSYSSRIRLMNDSYGLGIKTINYVRPLVKEWTTKNRLRCLADHIKGSVDAIDLSGIRITPEIRDSLVTRGLRVPDTDSYTNKMKDVPYFNEVTTMLREKTEVPVFWHTSCAMSYAFNEPDYNSHDIREKRSKAECEFPCIERQRTRCYSRKGQSSNKEIRRVIEKLGKNIKFRKEGETIFLKGGNLAREDISIIRHLLPEFCKKDD